VLLAYILIHELLLLLKNRGGSARNAS
jgi:hypothetical protein